PSSLPSWPLNPFLGSRAQRAFVGTKALVVLVMVAITFRLVEEKVGFQGAYKTLPCYLALFALAEIFELYITLDALRLRNVIELFGILAFHLGMLVTAALQVHETRTALVQQIGCDATVNAITCDGEGTLWSRVLPFLNQLYAEFGWAIFHVVGANPKMKEMYRYYQILLCLLKFDFFSFTGVTMQLLIVVLQRSSAEFGLTIAAIPVVFVLIVLCRIAAQREIRWIMIMSLFLMLASLVYFYKLVRFYEPASSQEYVSTRATLTVFTIVAFLLVSASFVIGLKCYFDFDRGLLESKVNNVSRHSRRTSSKVENMQEYQAGMPLTHRISIE
ncbi:hypothetical protein F5887DRAFT_940616, partial [Amanita rubescens]